MNRVKLHQSLLTFLSLIIDKLLDDRPMLDKRLVSLTEDLYDVIEDMATDFNDRNFEITTLLDERLISRGLDLPEEKLEELARYYIEKEV